MKILVYDYDGEPKEYELPDKEIEEISVSVLSGDETGTVGFTDGTSVDFDASDCRIISFDDGFYVLKDGDIQRWIEDGEKGVTAYGRLAKYGG